MEGGARVAGEGTRRIKEGEREGVQGRGVFNFFHFLRVARHAVFFARTACLTMRGTALCFYER